MLDFTWQGGEILLEFPIFSISMIMKGYDRTRQGIKRQQNIIHDISTFNHKSPYENLIY